MKLCHHIQKESLNLSCQLPNLWNYKIQRKNYHIKISRNWRGCNMHVTYFILAKQTQWLDPTCNLPWWSFIDSYQCYPLIKEKANIKSINIIHRRYQRYTSSCDSRVIERNNLISFGVRDDYKINGNKVWKGAQKIKCFSRINNIVTITLTLRVTERNNWISYRCKRPFGRIKEVINMGYKDSRAKCCLIYCNY